MSKTKENSPLLGYNTNVRHNGKLFHIQTEDSGIDHPHIITHLFVEGTILGTKKTTYDELLDDANREDRVRQLMKNQHKAMFIELRDGAHDESTDRILKESLNRALRDHKDGKTDKDPLPKAQTESKTESGAQPDPESDAQLEPEPENENEPDGSDSTVRVIHPATMKKALEPKKTSEEGSRVSRRSSIFTTPDSDGEFGEELISDKSLDEVILSYMNQELDE
jgi:hypothetical protein